MDLISAITIIGLFIAIGSIVYKYGRIVEEFKGIKKEMDNKMELLEQKYNTSEKIQNLELKFEKDLSELNTKLEILKEQRNADEKKFGENIGIVANELKNDLEKKFQIHMDGHPPKTGGGIQ